MTQEKRIGRVLLPPKIVSVDGPVIFLVGPVQSAPNWQRYAIDLIHAQAPDVHIANPRRKNLDGKFVYADQVDWETHYLRRAGKEGVVFAWLPRQPRTVWKQLWECVAKIVSGNRDTLIRPYAQTTRFELAEWKVRHERDGINLVVGIEDGFANGPYIRRRLEQDCPEISIVSILELACCAAVDRVRLRNPRSKSFSQIACSKAFCSAMTPLHYGSREEMEAIAKVDGWKKLEKPNGWVCPLCIGRGQASGHKSLDQ